MDQRENLGRVLATCVARQGQSCTSKAFCWQIAMMCACSIVMQCRLVVLKYPVFTDLCLATSYRIFSFSAEFTVLQ